MITNTIMIPIEIMFFIPTRIRKFSHICSVVCKSLLYKISTTHATLSNSQHYLSTVQHYLSKFQNYLSTSQHYRTI